MEELELVLIGLIAASIVMVFFSFLLFFRNVQVTKDIQRLNARSTSSSRRKKKIRQTIIKLKGIKHSRVKKVIFFMSLSVILMASSFALKSYISRSLSGEDGDTLAQAYYLVRNFEEQVELAAIKSEEEEKVVRNINYLATAMASYGVYTASYLNSEEGQLALNKYYGAIKELGINNTAMANELYGNQVLAEETRKDIKRIKAYEKKVVDYYQIDTSVLEKK